jgi:hypothetical protein
MQLQEIDTLQDLKLWVEENMQGAEVYEDMYGTLVIRTNLISTMGGYLSEREEDSDYVETVSWSSSNPTGELL